MMPQLRNRLEALLLAERDRTADTLHRVESEEAEPQSVSGGAATRTEWTPTEAASDVLEEETDFITATRASRHLTELDDALKALAEDPDSFGQCRRCGDAIDRARLELVPWSRLCATCARADGHLLGPLL